MVRYRIRIVLLSLGVLLGYGSAIHHFSHAHRGGESWYTWCHHHGPARSADR